MARTFVVVVMQKRAVRRAAVERLRQSHPTRTAAHRLQGVAQLLEQHLARRGLHSRHLPTVERDQNERLRNPPPQQQQQQPRIDSFRGTLCHTIRWWREEIGK